MKIAITAKGNNLDSELDETFAHCEYFLIIDLDTSEFEAIENPAKDALGGSGMQAVKIVSDKGIEAVIAGNVGPNAFKSLKDSGIKVYITVPQKVKDVLEEFKKGNLKESDNSTIHFGVIK
ncbi:MAG: dinitrogenase iron-molybdenum cofactor biosynthesis protein [Armatimonadetes bacterium CG07_land_8_20_14_0_80_40_9]|nr:MAG: dinitrogenase iron-molybdenum cofactor biosynthesis protein [Armatimonadetes bacterium CG07_land_8_20_14_0_80_40_9]